MNKAKQGVILFAHGSRDPLWRLPMESVAARVAARTGAGDVVARCAYLELTEPDLPHVADALVAEGATSLCVVPMFLGVGRHAREDLPELVTALKATHPTVDISCQPAVGEQHTLLDLLADIALGRANNAA